MCACLTRSQLIFRTGPTLRRNSSISSADGFLVFAICLQSSFELPSRETVYYTARTGELQLVACRMNILISNDDGCQARGIQVLAEALSAIASVTVVAPERDRSGASNSLTLDVPLRA